MEENCQMCPQIMRLIFPLPEFDFRDSKFYPSFFPKCIVKKQKSSQKENALCVLLDICNLYYHIKDREISLKRSLLIPSIC